MNGSLENVTFKNNTYNNLISSQSLIKAYSSDGAATFKKVVFEDNTGSNPNGKMIVFGDDNAEPLWSTAIASNDIQGVTADFQQK